MNEIINLAKELTELLIAHIQAQTEISKLLAECKAILAIEHFIPLKGDKQ